MTKTIERSVDLIRDLDGEIAAAKSRIDDGWREIRTASQAAALRRGRRKNMERSAAERARTRKLCQKAGLLELAGIIDEDDEVLVGLFLKAKEGLKQPERREAWRHAGRIKLLKRAKGDWPVLVIRFASRPPDIVLEKLDEDGFEYEPSRLLWLGEGDLAYGEKLIALSGVGGRARIEPQLASAEASR